jgi:Phage integrase, N-terminal SAM-like domain
MRFLEFFAANIRNPHTRRAYARAVEEFLDWCEAAGVPSIGAVQPVHVATWIEAGTRELAAPSVKQRLAAIRHLFDWLVTYDEHRIGDGAHARQTEAQNPSRSGSQRTRRWREMDSNFRFRARRLRHFLPRSKPGLSADCNHSVGIDSGDRVLPTFGDLGGAVGPTDHPMGRRVRPNAIRSDLPVLGSSQPRVCPRIAP